jgi:hypothetical protein
MALTNKPWLSGLKPFGVNAGEKIAVMSFSEEVDLAGPITKPNGNHMLPKGVTPCTEGSSNGFTGDGKTCHTHDGSSERVQAAMKAAASDAGISLSEAELADYAQHHTGGGDRMSELLEELSMSEDEVRQALSERQDLLAERRENRIEDLCRKWEDDDHKSPAVIAAARTLLMARVDGDKLLLSENGKTKEMSFEDGIIGVVEASPELVLSEEDKSGGGKNASEGNEPPEDTEHENAAANLSQEVKVEANRLFFEENMSSEDAIAAAKKKFDVKDE